MAKVFTITQGLENLGPMKTGGQGAVYKGRRIGEIISAVKLLPTPIYSESIQDKNYRDFTNEVQKLKKVNENPNPNIVKILSSGLSETGNFPFIEMEYIDGPDLEELLQSANYPVFPLHEVVKVASHLSNALAHCHRIGIKHGDIKSNNVKFNIKTGNYVLLDFGLAIMSDEQRRTSLRRAGAVEFMAPEQNEGQMLFQTDVYSFGIILFELLTGSVPFPLKGKGETARNEVRLAHIESLPPDVLDLRKEAVFASSWPQDIKEREVNLPKWLETVISKSLNKKPENRFADGIELNSFIAQSNMRTLDANMLTPASEKVQEEQQLQKQLVLYNERLAQKEREFEELRIKVDTQKTSEPLLKRETEPRRPLKKRVAKSAFVALLVFTIALFAFSAYSFLKNSGQEMVVANSKDGKLKQPVSKTTKDVVDPNKTKKIIKKVPQQTPADSKETADDRTTLEKPNKTPTKYTVKSVAYFHNTPDESTRRAAFINKWNNSVLTPQDDKNGYIYIVYTNDKGQVSKGWLSKQDLKPVN